MVQSIRKAFIYSAILASVVLLSAWAITIVFEEEVNKKVLSAINSNLRAPIEVGTMELSMFHRFPNPSVHLKNVLIREALPEKVQVDTLLYAEDLFLEIDLIGMFTGSISVGELEASDIVLNPGINANGEHNYRVWESDSSATQNTIAVKKIELNDFRLRYKDVPAEFILVANASDLELTGLFNESGSTFGIAGDVFFDSIQVSNEQYVHQLQTALDLRVQLPEQGAVMVIKDGILEANGLTLHTDILWQGTNADEQLAVLLSAKNADLEGAASLIPELGPYLTEHYGIRGTSDLDVTYAGYLNRKRGPALTLKLNVHDGRMREHNTGVVFDRIRMLGEMTLDDKGDLQALTVDRFNARAGNGSIGGDLVYAAGKSEYLKGTIQSSIDLADLFHFMRSEQDVSGYMALKANFKGPATLRDGFTADDLKQLQISGRSDMKNASFHLKGMRHGIENLNATLLFEGSNASVPSMNATVLNDDIRLTGTLRGLFPYLLFDDERLLIEASVQSDHLNLEEILSSAETETGESRQRDLSLPSNIDMNIELNVKELQYATFTANEIITKVAVQNGTLSAKPFSFKSSGGKINGSLNISTNVTTEFPFVVNAELIDINVAELFRSFDDFGQEFIRREHLKGTMNSTVELHANLSRSMQLNRESLNSSIQLSIKNGELIEHGPMMEIADFIRENKLYATFIRTEELESKLRHIRFKELTNTVRIENNMVIIPYMAVESNALNVNLSGSHSFDDIMDHHVNFRIAELLMSSDKDAEFGEVVDDGTGMRIFLRMHGPSENLTIEHDKPALAQFRKAKMDSEKQELKDILKDPFNRKDVTPDNTTDRPKFNVEWDEESDKPQPKKKNGIGGLFDKITNNEQKDVSFQVEE
jgi:uncharacterized protein involved in outer membrane biogenesis